MATYRRRKKREADSLPLPWGRDPLKGLLGDTPRVEAVVPTRKRTRYYSPLKERGWCPRCGAQRWSVILDDTRYRDMFLACGQCHETFRMDMTPLDFQYAWRDGIPMPKEVKLKYHRRH